MQNKLNSPNLPDRAKFASVLRLLSQISYWIHLILGATSALILGLILFSRKLGTPANNTAISISIFLTIASLVAVGIRIFFAWRYNRIAKQLKSATPIQPNRLEIVNLLRIALIISLTGLILAFLASETTVVSIIAQAIAQPQGPRVYGQQQAIETADLFLDFVNVTILGAHALGTINSLGLLNWITRE
ncbi:DUF3611 family protein [Crocosphaera chwakensis]|uniref:DUF3611 family protein n=1 Tax=Crocosphaera chwakensis CCY0110 TaxID=391612 RepID=A3IWF3_9CHRO|nr:DUF3611 family protein [Crocosphaera chwakensis]EAZ89204.1 hypothetical protein CY0110_15440 [Crocosphaera chwakensis CCY0110]